MWADQPPVSNERTQVQERRTRRQRSWRAGGGVIFLQRTIWQRLSGFVWPAHMLRVLFKKEKVWLLHLAASVCFTDGKGRLRKPLANHHHVILNDYFFIQNKKRRPTPVYMLLTGLPHGRRVLRPFSKTEKRVPSPLHILLRSTQ